MKKKIFFTFAALLVLILLWVWTDINDTVSAPAYPIDFSITQGESIVSVSESLANAHLIQNRTSFVIYGVLSGRFRTLQARTFTFEQPLTSREILYALTVPITVPAEVQMTFLEGWTVKQMAAALSEGKFEQYEGDFGADFLAVQESFDVSSYPLLQSKPKNLGLEGYLFPDTYRFFQTAQPAEVVKIMLDNFSSKFTPEMLAEMEKQKKSVHQIVTLASILEREVQTPEDKKKVADLFYRRMKVGMPLQADSTINYITGKNDPAVSVWDIEVDSPYNTYKKRGLPPGPIANPGSDSIMAAIYPEKNDSWFFLTRLDTGEVLYSVTFEEHLEKQAKYLK